MKIKNLAEEAEDFTGNVWLLENNNEAVLIDAGTGDSWKSIKELESVDKVVITHSHYDHVDNLPKIADKFDPEVYAFKPSNLPVKAEELGEGEEIDLGGARFRAIHTSGHRDDSPASIRARRRYSSPATWYSRKPVSVELILNRETVSS